MDNKGKQHNFFYKKQTSTEREKQNQNTKREQIRLQQEDKP